MPQLLRKKSYEHLASKNVEKKIAAACRSISVKRLSSLKGGGGGGECHAIHQASAEQFLHSFFIGSKYESMNGGTVCIRNWPCRKVGRVSNEPSGAIPSANMWSAWCDFSDKLLCEYEHNAA